MKKARTSFSKDDLKIEVPDQVYNRLVKMLIDSVMQEEKIAASKKIKEREKKVERGAL